MRIQKLNYETKTNLLEDLLQRSPNQYTQYESRVLEILEHVKNEKDQAVFDYTKQFDGADITADTITVTKEEIAQAYDLVDTSLVEIIRKQKKIFVSTMKSRNSIAGLTANQTAPCLGKR